MKYEKMRHLDASLAQFAEPQDVKILRDLISKDTSLTSAQARAAEVRRVWRTRLQNTSEAGINVHGLRELVTSLIQVGDDEQIEQLSFADELHVANIFLSSLGQLLGYVIAPRRASSDMTSQRTHIQQSSVQSRNSPLTEDEMAADALRLLNSAGYTALPEVELPGGLRADIMAVGQDGKILILEFRRESRALAPEYVRQLKVYCDAVLLLTSANQSQRGLPKNVEIISLGGLPPPVLYEQKRSRMSARRRMDLAIGFGRLAAQRYEHIHTQSGSSRDGTLPKRLELSG